MKIKDIRQFRTFYKDNIRKTKDSNRDEHFVGAEIESENGESIFGFFDLYHGDKVKEVVGGIKGFLEGFLEMAQDTQAIYEFMQNAVDANSSHFTMVWDCDEDQNDYLLVLNNGKQFDFASIRSILNVGVSTKKPEDHSIGKFGIGFKLAHRLVGKDNGIDELLNKNYGPLLFSWNNYGIKELLNIPIDSIEPVTQKYESKKINGEQAIEIIGEEPWLFKILITNFPTQPDETIKDAYYNEVKDALSSSDVGKLSEWLNKYQRVIPINEYETGSLFFLKLGDNKSSKLDDENLREGIRFSLSILNRVSDSNVKGLQSVHLNGTDIENASLLYEDFSIDKSSEDYRYIRFGKKDELNHDERLIADKDSNIQLLFGYTDYKLAVELIKNVPNFYLYFPLSEEKHNLKFILHSNAFYKKSARTSLHSDAINERLLETFAELIIRKMTSWTESTLKTDHDKFLAIYPVLLLSKVSSDADRSWVNKPLIEKIHAFLKSNIPVSANNEFGYVVKSNSSNVKVKNTMIEIGPEMFNADIFWFYWGKDEILAESINQVLEISEFSIVDILFEKGVATKLNSLFERNSQARIILLNELNSSISRVSGTNTNTEIFKDNFLDLNLFEFDNGVSKSINQLKEDAGVNKYLLLFEEISELKTILTVSGFICTKESLAKHQHIQDFIRGRQLIDYNDYKVLNEYLSAGFETANLSVDEKHKVCQVLERAKDREKEIERNQRMQALKLFANAQGDIVALGSLLRQAPKPWLKPFEITEEENKEYLHRYLVTGDDAYVKVVIPLWDKVIADKKGLIRSDIKSFFADIVAFQEATKQTQTLSDKVFIPTGTEFLPFSEGIYYQPEWTHLTGDDYKTLDLIFETFFSKKLPLQDSLDFLKRAPFSLSTSSVDNLTLNEIPKIEKNEIIVLAKAATLAKLPLFDRFIIQAKEASFQIRSKKENEYIIWCNSDDKVLETHISSCHSNLTIAPQITELKGLVDMKDRELADYCVNQWDGLNETYNESLSNLVVSHEDSIKVAYLKKCGNLCLDINNKDDYKRLKNLVKVSLSFADITIAKDILADALTVKINEKSSFRLGQIITANSDAIHFGEANEYVLKLSNIFTSEEAGYSRHIESLVEKLHADFDYDKVKLLLLFNIKETEDKSSVLARINLSIQGEHILTNGSQLCFILLMKKYNPDALDLSLYNIRVGSTIKKLEGNIAVSRNHFGLFKNDVYLDDCYAGVAGILKIAPNSPFFKVDRISLYLHPVIENSTVLGPELKENLPINEQIDLLEFLLPDSRGSSALTGGQPWTAVLGFDPKLLVSSKFALKEKEGLPEHIYNWSRNESNEDKRKRKASLLSALGFNLPWSPIVRLREVLLDDKSTKSFYLQEVDQLPVELLANTLILLQKHRQNFLFNSSYKYFDVLKSIVKLAIQNAYYEIPLPVTRLTAYEYGLASKTDGAIYYYDNNDFQQLFQINTSLREIVRAIQVRVYDATSWTESQDLKSSLQKIEITTVVDDGALIKEREEWSEVFYEEWKSQHPDLLLYYYDHLTQKLFLADNYIGSVKDPLFYKDDGNIYCPRKFSFQEIVAALRSNNFAPVKAIDDLVGLYNAHQMRIQELLNNPIIDEDTRKIVEQKKRELEEIAHRKELKESLAQNKYCYKWFLDFIEIQKLQAGESDSSLPEQEISFFAAEWEIDSQRLIKLKDPNRTVTPTIEYCSDFRATFQFNSGRPVEVKIQDVSKKGQIIWAMLAKPKELAGVDLTNVKRIDLKFSRSVNLLSRLYNAFKRLGIDNSWNQIYNLKDNLTHDINFIYGPPGTGKTTLIAKRLIKKMEDFPNLKILVLTPTNKAADVLTHRIMSKTEDYDTWLVRYGATFSNDIIERELLKDKSSFIYQAYTRCVFITTIHRIPYEEAILTIEDSVPVPCRIADMHWDIVVFDEASMIPLSYIVYAMYKCGSRLANSTTEYWVGGDPYQIPPVVDIDDEDLPADFNKDENIYTLVDLKNFNEDEQKKVPIYGEQGKIDNLRTQYRSVEAIGKLFSKFTYGGELIHDRAKKRDGTENSRQLPKQVSELGIKPLTLLKFPVNLNDSVYTPAKLRKSPYHVYSAILILEMVRHFEQSISHDDNWTIGIVCPYRSQATLINKMIESLNLKHNLNVITDTVHGFQGDECDLVYFIVNPPNYSISDPSYGAFVHKHYLVNVAISRARDYLVVVYPDDQTQGINNLEKINKSKPGSIEDIIINELKIPLDDVTVSSRAVEQKLFGDSKFIEKNIITNKHQLVNVYNVAEKKYLVRESTTAIDIQFRT